MAISSVYCKYLYFIHTFLFQHVLYFPSKYIPLWIIFKQIIENSKVVAFIEFTLLDYLAGFLFFCSSWTFFVKQNFLIIVIVEKNWYCLLKSSCNPHVRARIKITTVLFFLNKKPFFLRGVAPTFANFSYGVFRFWLWSVHWSNLELTTMSYPIWHLQKGLVRRNKRWVTYNSQENNEHVKQWTF